MSLEWYLLKCDIPLKILDTCRDINTSEGEICGMAGRGTSVIYFNNIPALP
jgi:hypothetical protein